MTITVAIILVGVLASLFVISCLIWSILVPEKRFWPPEQSTRGNRILVWILTVIVFTSAFILGVMDWNALKFPALVQWGIGFPMVLLGNWFAWSEAFNLGMETTSGAVGNLRTQGLYKYSRNPQYVADVGILVGWMILSGSIWSLPVLAAGVLALVLAPFAEESWLRHKYGETYIQYCRNVRRFI